MADNSSIPVAVGNELFANKDIGGVKFPKNIQYDSTGAEVVPATQLTLAAVLNAISSSVVTAGTDSISAKAAIDKLMNGLVELTPKFAPVTASASGANLAVAAVVGKKIRVMAYNFLSHGTVNVKFVTGAAGADLTGLKPCVVNSGLVAPFCQVGWFETVAGDQLTINLSAAVVIGGELVYAEV